MPHLDVEQLPCPNGDTHRIVNSDDGMVCDGCGESWAVLDAAARSALARPRPPDGAELLPERAFAARLGVCLRTMIRWRHRANTPQAYETGLGWYYDAAEVDAWFAANTSVRT